MPSRITQMADLSHGSVAGTAHGLPFGRLSNRDERCLILSMRHFGDAVICAGFVRALQRLNPKMPVDVLGRAEHEEIFRSLCPITNYYGFDFPVFGHHARSLSAIIAAFHTLRQIRNMKYLFCINLIGDTREDLAGWLTGATWNIAPVWAPGHLFLKKITVNLPLPFANCGITIPARFQSYYASLRYFEACLSQPGIDPLAGAPCSRPKPPRQNLTISLHPGASHPSRHWPPEKWKDLMKSLAHQGYRLLLIGAPAETTTLRNAYREEIDRFGINVVTSDVHGFLSALSGTDALIAMDSFSAHAAHIVGVPSVVLNGSANAVIMTPPSSVPVSAGHLCPRYPCYYRYPCKGAEGEFLCCRGIEVQQVLDALDNLLTMSIFGN